MTSSSVKTHHDGIWISMPREIDVIKTLATSIIEQGWVPSKQDANNYGYPYEYQKNQKQLRCRLIDSVFMDPPHPDFDNIYVTDNHPISPTQSLMISVLPEFWSIWQFDPVFENQPASRGFNCFMNRPRGSRNIIFYELIKRGLIDQGLISYNCEPKELEQEYQNAEFFHYQTQHETAKALVPFNSVESCGTLEQCIIDSKISLVAETYTSDSHTVFSEKIFRCLQLPRPWLLYCSPGSIELLQTHGFDVMSDWMDISYDQIDDHFDRLDAILTQLENTINKEYSTQDYDRFDQACDHNRTLLKTLADRWPDKLQKILDQIQQL
jgi:hypothetical protein